ncbi:aminotransferase class V-fold PLP-dependent enzyme [Paracoccus suum]|uniref:Aminotransferase class V-fold PLP-dependent enzyme n=1 Tax=Paracoccus suum TaxID=2259340 RepID=A0A344PMJ0_9RHOB|nr:aminotransferase class V-fold PLP-dependent enzyme [Paracoccus suum]AXC50595.1 aminotransferase class V-fold PLP-dependent enzyme [Paracoccus suum]
MQSLDLDAVRAEFPGLSRGWTLMDNAGGSQILRGVVARMTEFLFERNVQIGGTYAVSQAAADALAQGRYALAEIMNAARPEEIVFGPSTTVLLQNLARAMRHTFAPGDEIIVHMGDHESNIGPWMGLEEFGVTIRRWQPAADGTPLDMDALDALLSERTRLVAVTHASNILGWVNDVAEVGRRVHAAGARMVVDGVAYAAHRAIDVQALGADFYVFSLYKTYGPHYAAMYGRYDLLEELETLSHYFYGRDRVPGKLEPGNPSYECAYSAVAIRDYLAGIGGAPGRAGIVAGFDAIRRHEDGLTGRLLDWAASRNDVHVIGPTSNPDSRRLPTLALRVSGKDSDALCRIMDQDRIAVRHGDFHSRRLVETLGETGHGGLLRLSLVHYNTPQEVEAFIAGMSKAIEG